MKHLFRRFVISAAAFILVFTLAGCSGPSPREAIQRAVQASAEAKNYDLSTTMNMTFGIAGVSVNMKMTSQGTYFVEPLKMKSTTTIDMGMLGTTEMEQYVVEEGGSTVSYTKDSISQEWSRQELPLDVNQLSQYSMAATFAMYERSADSFRITGREEINGASANKLEGVITGDDMEGYVDNIMGTAGMGEMLGGDSAIFADVLNAMSGEGAGINIVMWIDRQTFMPLRYSMDMTEMMSAVMGALLESAPEIGGMEISGVVMDMEFANINSAADFELPEELQ